MTTAPHVRRLAKDEELREDVNDFVRSANSLVTHLRSDRRLRRDVGNMISSVQSGGGRLRADVRPHHYARSFLVGTGLIILGIGAAIAVGWPRARRGVTRLADQTTARATSTVRDIRERMSGQSESRAA